MNRMKLEDKIERRLYNLICAGGGDGDTIKEMAKSIAKTARKHISDERLYNAKPKS